MCGIGGELYYFDAQNSDPKTLERMGMAMKERGPDDQGIYTRKGLGLVHRRLKIIDLSSVSRCPMSNEDHTLQVIFNGEIFNYRELRKELLSCGHQFRSQGDTEVIVHGYEEWGKDVVLRLEGMFAFAVWDERQKQLFLARDRFGEKPLYYVTLPKQFAFASSINALATILKNEMNINWDAMRCFLSYSYIPGPQTIWNEIQQLPPAHWINVDTKGNISKEPYWDFPSGPPLKMSVAEAEELVETSLDDSVQKRLIADVPVGGFLSGGVDSSLVMALAAKHASKIDTFSIGFKEKNFSELIYAKQVANTIGSTHHELVVDEKDALAIIPELIWQYGQPFGDSSCIPTHLVSRFARQNVTVCLSGDGGDESFAGYRRALVSWYTGIYQRLVPKEFRNNRVPSLCTLIEHYGFSEVTRRIRNLNELSIEGVEKGYTNSQSWLNRLKSLEGDKLAGPTYFFNPVSCKTLGNWKNSDNSNLRAVLYDDFKIQLPDDFLVKVDVASMTSSVEVRLPFLDHRFVELAWQLPEQMKLHWGETKWLLKRVAARHVPKSVVYRKKMGFALPMVHWWRGSLGNILEILMADSRCVSWGWINRDPVLQALSAHRCGQSEHSTRLWLILCLELWARIVVEGSMNRSISLEEVL